MSSPHYYNKLGFFINSQDNYKKKELETFVLNNTKDIIESSWVSTKLVHGNIEQCLSAFVNEQKIDLIIARQAIFKRFSTERNAVFKQIFLNISNLPTLLIPEHYSFQPMHRFAYLTAFKQDDYANVKWLTDNFLNSKIEVLHFSRDSKENPEQRRWIKYLTNEMANKNVVFNHKDLTVDEFIEQEASNDYPDYDCLVLTTHKRNFWQKLIDPSTILGFLNNIETPALVFKYTSDKLNI